MTEYPTGLFDNAKGNAAKGCEIFSTDYFDLNLDLKDAQLVRELAERLNAILKMEAKNRKWFFVSGIAADFRGHGYCTDDKTRLFVKAEESLIFQGDTEGTVHPNAAGHALFANRIATVVKKNTLDKPDLKLLTSGATISPGGKAKLPANR